MNWLALRGPLYQLDRAAPVAIVLGAAAPLSVRAVRYDRSAEPAFDASTFRRVRFEIPMAALPSAPAKGDTITDAAAVVWEVIEIEEKPEVGAWMLTVEQFNG